MNLNISQREIAMTEQAAGGSGRNTISAKLWLPDFSPEAVSAAADAVFDSADIFAATVRTRGMEQVMEFGREKISACLCAEERSEAQALEYMDRMDREALDMERNLYLGEAIPLSEGGAVLYVRFHHIIIDGYGMSLFVQRVLDALAGKPLQRSVFQDTVLQEETGSEEDFWRGCFAGSEFEPGIFPQNARGKDYAAYAADVPEDLAEEIASFSFRESVSPAVVFSAAYAFYLARATGRRDAVFLMPRLNRRPAQRDVLGCYTLLVPVKVRAAEAGTFAELCRMAKASSSAASANKAIGFDRILAVLREENQIGETLSEYVFNFYPFIYQTDLRCRISYSVAGAMSNHLTWNLFRGEKGGFVCRLDLRKGVYTEEKAAYFCQAMWKILKEGMSGKPLEEIDIAGDAEAGRLASIRGRSIEIEKNLTIPSLFRKAAERYRQKPALYAGEETFTFEELDRMSDNIAAGLLRRGIQKGDRAAFMLKRDFRLIPALLGISKAGAVFIPVDPAYPEDRIAYILENSRAACLLSSKDVSAGAGYIEIDDLLQEQAELGLLPSIAQEDPAYIIYTSGTTGRPKGVVLSHRGIANIVHPDNNPFNRYVTENCRGITAIGSICFDISLFEIFVPLLNGLFVELGSEKAMTDAKELAGCISRHHGDILHCTPSRITAYLASEAFAKALSGVKAVLAAGEVVPGSLVRKLRDTYGIRVYNGYGPTETTIGATITEAGDAETIGWPIANTGVLLLNRALKPVPFGAMGEICVYGAGLGIGYYQKPEETAEKFIRWRGLRLYRTGDLGYFAEDGRLIYCGRNDRQIKLRGLRIELSEIEKVMSEFPGIAACCCMVRKIEKNDHLVSFYTPEAGASVDEDGLREHLKSNLASYMVPDVIKALAAMPETPGGKIDQKALAAEPVTYSRLYRRPVTEKEIIVCRVFEEVLGAEKIGLDDNFFELGGDSLSAVSAVLSIEEKLDLAENRIEMGDLYKYPTPSMLLSMLSLETEADRGFPIGALDYRGIDDYLASHTTPNPGKGRLGNVLLTGAAGYLGIHILIALLREPELTGKIVCLARKKKTISAEKRVKTALFYYDETDFLMDYGEKWVVCEGDITEPEIFTEPCGTSFDTIINSAANVTHFAYGSELEESNTRGVANLIRFAEKQKAQLCQISTISVAGMTAGGRAEKRFSEKDFYIGQEIHNQYIYSKFMAEYQMLRAAVDRGLRIKIMRVGNLQGRISDGEFQMNLHKNAFTRQLAAYIKIGAVPASVYHSSVNFSPVDETAEKITALAATTEDAAVFHVYPPKEVEFSSIFAGLAELGHDVLVLPDEEFDALLQKLKRTEEGRSQIEGLFTRVTAGALQEIPVVQTVTGDAIRARSKGWSPITEEYLKQYLSALDGLNLF